MPSRRDKAAVFIDNGYFAKVLRNDFGEPRIDYLRLSENMCSGCERFRTYFYYCLPYQSPRPSTDDQVRFSNAQRFYSSLRKHPRFEVRLGRVVRRGTSSIVYEQKGVDVLLSVDLVRLSWSHTIDKAILVSGDSDFVPAVQAAKDAGIIVDLFHSEKQHVSSELYQTCDERHSIDESLVQSSLMGWKGRGDEGS